MEIGQAVLLVSTFFFCLSSEQISPQLQLSRNKVSISGPIPSVVMSSSYNASDTSRRVISLLAAANIGGVLYPMGTICSESMQFALDTIKRTPNFLPDYEIKIQLIDDACSRPPSVSQVVGALRENEKAIGRFPLSVGPYCQGQLYVAQIVHHYNFIGITSYSPASEKHNYRRRYHSYFPINPPAFTGYTGVADFMVAMGWLEYAIISENSDYFIEPEKALITTMEKKNGSKLLGRFSLPYVSGLLVDSVHAEIAVRELSRVDPRIIILNAVQPARVACWLHRYKLFGPNYVIFIAPPALFTPNDQTRFTDWCTPDMLAEVLESSFLQGDANALNLDDRTVTDVLGVGGMQLQNYLLSAIDQPETSRQWWFWRSHCYDSVVSAATILNATEAKLKSRNQTLSDWTTDKPQFQERGGEIQELVKDSLYSTRFRTMAGEVEFDRATMANTRGRMGTGIFQLRRNPSNSQFFYPFPVAIYNPEGGKNTITFGPSNIEWKTPGGRPPPDSIQVLRIETPTISEGAYGTIICLSVVQLICILAVTGHNLYFRNIKPALKQSVPLINGFILAGNIVLQGYLLVQPLKSSSLNQLHCMVAYGCLFEGLACLFFGIWGKLEFAELFSAQTKRTSPLRSVITPSNGRSRSTVIYANKNLGIQRNSSLTIKRIIVFGLIFVITSAALLTAWFTMSPLLILQVTSPIKMSENDISLAYQYHYFECVIDDSSDIAPAIIAILCSIYAVIVLRSCYLAYVLRQVRLTEIVDLQAIGRALYGTVILLACIALIAGFIFRNNQQNQRITLSFGILGCVAINMGVIFRPLIFASTQS